MLPVACVVLALVAPAAAATQMRTDPSSKDPGPQREIAISVSPELTTTTATTIVEPSPTSLLPAPSVQSAPPQESLTRQQRCTAAVVMVGYHPPSGWSLVCSEARVGFLGLADPNTKTLTLYAESDADLDAVAFTYAHELGHSLDFEYMSTTDRDAWLAARGRPDAQWFACEMCPDFPYGQGDLAEVMGYMLVPTGREYFRSQVAPAPTDAQMLLLRQLTRLDEQQRAL